MVRERQEIKEEPERGHAGQGGRRRGHEPTQAQGLLWLQKRQHPDSPLTSQEGTLGFSQWGPFPVRGLQNYMVMNLGCLKPLGV